MVIIENLRKAFGDNQVLEDVNLTLYDEEILTIVGMSGIGKSVLLKMIVGLVEADSGHIYLDDIDVTQLHEEQLNDLVRTQISMVFQQGALWDSLTVQQNIELALDIRHNLSKPERIELVKESLELVGLRDAENLYPEELSGGMVKRASIARAIAARPKYLFFDEPTTGLDPVLANMVNDLIVKLHRELRTTTLVVSHDVAHLQHFTQRVAMLHAGRIVHVCTARDMWNQDNRIFNSFIRGELDVLYENKA